MGPSISLDGSSYIKLLGLSFEIVVAVPSMVPLARIKGIIIRQQDKPVANNFNW